MSELSWKGSVVVLTAGSQYSDLRSVPRRGLFATSWGHGVLLFALAKILEREGSISPSCFYGPLPDY